jgi:hypothetical protein
MLAMGVFGGWYFEGKHDELPLGWLKSAQLSQGGFDQSLNYFRVASGQSRQHWTNHGWITPEDPLGWFQWYCRYTIGRRLPRVDAFQISRWQAFGPRHTGALKANCECGDIWCRPRQRQALLQWGYDPLF